MTSISLTFASNRAKTAGIVLFAAALAAASQISIPLPGTPVPLTLQPFIVVLAGLWLGPRAGAASMALFLVAGAIGLPVFSPIGPPGIARFMSPTGGYLLAYPAAAWIVGTLAARTVTFAGRFAATSAGIAMIYLGGLANLAVINSSLVTAIKLGITPFIALDLAKAAVAAAITPTRR